MYIKAKFKIVGDCGLSVEFGNDLSEETNQLVHKFNHILNEANLAGVIETIPTIRSLYIYYDHEIIRIDKLKAEIIAMEEGMTEIVVPRPKLFKIPIVYGGEYGPDFDMVAQLLGLTPKELVQIHSGREYFVLQTGFVGGSAYFKTPPQLDALKRKNTPNFGAPAGAVLVAGGMGILFKALAGPTGWYWIGMSPLQQWFPEKDPPLLVNSGDKIIYKPVSIKKFKQIKKKIEKGGSKTGIFRTLARQIFPQC